MKQWHPIFAQILRQWVEEYFEVSTNLPVGDLPREADIVLVKRESSRVAPFQGIFRKLRQWNVLEFKGPSVTPRKEDLDLLVELGLGIDRRLNEKQSKEGLRILQPSQITYWFLANHFGKGFLHHAEEGLNGLDAVQPGMWVGSILHRSVYLVSCVDVPFEPDSVPLHLVAKEPLVQKLELAEFILDRRDLWKRFGEWFIYLHKDAWKEVAEMSRIKTKDLKPDIRPLAEFIGFKKAAEQMGLKRLVEEFGVKRMVQEVGLPRVLREVSMPDLVKELSSEQLKELKVLLQ